MNVYTKIVIISCLVFGIVIASGHYLVNFQELRNENVKIRQEIRIERMKTSQIETQAKLQLKMKQLEIDGLKQQTNTDVELKKLAVKQNEADKDVAVKIKKIDAKLTRKQLRKQRRNKL